MKKTNHQRKGWSGPAEIGAKFLAHFGMFGLTLCLASHLAYANPIPACPPTLGNVDMTGLSQTSGPGNQTITIFGSGFLTVDTSGNGVEPLIDHKLVGSGWTIIDDHQISLTLPGFTGTHWIGVYDPEQSCEAPTPQQYTVSGGGGGVALNGATPNPQTVAQNVTINGTGFASGMTAELWTTGSGPTLAATALVSSVDTTNPLNNTGVFTVPLPNPPPVAGGTDYTLKIVVGVNTASLAGTFRVLPGTPAGSIIPANLDSAVGGNSQPQTRINGPHGDTVLESDLQLKNGKVGITFTATNSGGVDLDALCMVGNTPAGCTPVNVGALPVTIQCDLSSNGRKPIFAWIEPHQGAPSGSCSSRTPSLSAIVDSVPSGGAATYNNQKAWSWYRVGADYTLTAKDTGDPLPARTTPGWITFDIDPLRADLGAQPPAGISPTNYSLAYEFDVSGSAPTNPFICSGNPLTTTPISASDPVIGAVSYQVVSPPQLPQCLSNPAQFEVPFTTAKLSVTITDDRPGKELLVTWNIPGTSNQQDVASGNSVTSTVDISFSGQRNLSAPCQNNWQAIPGQFPTGTVTVKDNNGNVPTHTITLNPPFTANNATNTASVPSHSITIFQRSQNPNEIGAGGISYLKLCATDSEGNPITINNGGTPYQAVKFNVQQNPVVSLVTKDLSASRVLQTTPPAAACSSNVDGFNCTATPPAGLGAYTAQGVSVVGDATDPTTGQHFLPNWTVKPQCWAGIDCKPISTPTENGYELISEIVDGVQSATSVNFSVQGSRASSTQISANFGLDMKDFRPSADPFNSPGLDPTKTHFDIVWKREAYPAGGQLVLQGYKLVGKVGGVWGLLTTNPSTLPTSPLSFSIDLANASLPNNCWNNFKNSNIPCSGEIYVASIYRSNLTGQTYRFDSPTGVPFTLSPVNPPTLHLDFYDLQTNTTLLSCQSPTGCPGTPAWPFPVGLHMYGTAATGDTLTSVTPGIVSFRGATFSQNALDARLLLIQDNLGAQNGTAPGTAVAQQGGATAFTQNFGLDLTSMAPPSFGGTCDTAGNCQLQIGHPNFLSNSAVTLLKYDVLATSNQGSLTGGVGFVPSAGTMNVNVNLANYPGWPGTLPFTVDLTVRATYSVAGVAQQFHFDKTYITQISAGPTPQITFTFTSLNTGASLGTCSQGGSNPTCTAPVSFQEPIAVNVQGTVSAGTLSFSPPTVSGPLPLPVFVGPTNSYSAKFAASLVSPSVQAIYDLSNIGAKGSLGGTLTWQPVAIGKAPGEEKYTLNLSGYFANPFGFTPVSGSAIDYSWTAPAAGLGNNFAFKGWELQWDLSVDPGPGGTTNPILAQSSSFATNTASIDFANLSNPVNSYFKFWKQGHPNQAFPAPVILRMIYMDKTNSNQPYTFDLPKLSNALAVSAPDLVWEYTGAATGKVCTLDTNGHFTCPFSLFDEPGILRVRTTPEVPAKVAQWINGTPSFAGGIAPARTKSNNSVNDASYFVEVGGGYDVSLSAKDDLLNVAAPTDAIFGVDVSSFVADLQSTANSMVAITYNWNLLKFITNPPVPASNLKLVSIELKWDDAAAGTGFAGGDQTLVSVANPSTSISQQIDFRFTNSGLVNAYAASQTTNFPTYVYMLATYQNTVTNDSFFVRGPTHPQQTTNDLPPVITWTTTGLLTGHTCVTHLPSQAGDCIPNTTHFDEPQDLKILFTDPDSTVATSNTTLSYLNISGSHNVTMLPTLVSDEYQALMGEHAKFTAAGSAVDNLGTPTPANASQSYTLDLSSFVPGGYQFGGFRGSGQSISSIKYNWTAPIYLTMPQIAGWQLFDITMRWAPNWLSNGTIDPSLPAGDPTVQSGLKTVTSTTIDFSKTSFWIPPSPSNPVFTAVVYLDAQYMDQKGLIHHVTTFPLTQTTSPNVTLANPGVLVSVTSNTITGKWTLSATELSQIQGLRVNAVDSKGNFVNTTPALDLRGQTINPTNVYNFTSTLLQSNTSFVLTLEGTYDMSVGTFFNFINSSFTATTNAATPPMPTATIGSCNPNAVPLQITTNIGTDLYNSPDSLYAVGVSSNGLPVQYLDPVAGVLVTNPIWLSVNAWAAFGPTVTLNDAGLKNTLGITTVVQEKNTSLPVPSSSTVFTTPGGAIQVTFPTLSTVSYDTLLFGVSFTTPKFQTTFSTDMDPVSLQTPGNVTLTDVQTATPVTINVPSYNAATKTMTVTPATPLKPFTEYRINIVAGLLDKCGFPTTQSFSQLFVTTHDATKNAQLFHPLDAVRNTYITIPANALSATSFVVPRTAGFIAPAGPVTAAAPSIDNSVRANQAFREVRRVEILCFNNGTSGAPAMGNCSSPIGLTMSGQNVALGSKALAPQLNNGIDPNTQDIYFVDTQNNYRLVPMKGTNVNGVTTAQITKSGTYILGGLVSANLNSAYAYPVPFRPASGHSIITFTNLGIDSTVKVYTIMGELVQTLTDPANTGTIQWNVRNADGDNVASGVYLYQIKNAFSEKRGKLMIIR